MINEAKKLVDNYALWLKESTDLRQVDKYVEITTPFLDRHNDHIQLYLSKEDESFMLTDDGYTLSDLSISGCEVDTEKRKQLLTQTLNGFGVTRLGDALTVKTDLTRFPQKKHNLLQAILAVNDLFYTASPLVLSLFLEDVQAWLDKNEIRYTPNIPVCGSDEIYEATICCDCEKEVGEGELDEDDLCPECAARADAYDEMVDRVKEALSTPFDMAQMVKQILTKPKGELK